VNKNDSQTTFLKPVIDDLVKQTDSSKQSIELLVSKVEKLEKNKPVKVVKKKRVKKKAVAKSRWVVNLVAFRQKWYAANKLQEFKKKGVPADLIAVKVKGETWYRLRVKGFKSKEKATTYSVGVKKKLNLGSVWVTKG
jgi:cell division protein FtsN